MVVLPVPHPTEVGRLALLCDFRYWKLSYSHKLCFHLCLVLISCAIKALVMRMSYS